MTTPWFGLHMPSYTHPGFDPSAAFELAAGQAQAAEAAGFTLITAMDHFNQIPTIGAQDEPMLEGWSVLAALARETSRVRLSTLVSGVTYRNPALLAKLATTLDVISGGRALFGIGAAWFAEEHAGFGFAFPPISERMDRLDEALTIVRGMFAHERTTFEGRFYHVSDAINVPRPVQPGGPRVIVGGGGEQRTLRIAAKHADLTHWFPVGAVALSRKMALLEGYCADIGRDPGAIERTMATPVMVAASEAAGAVLLERLPAERRRHVIVGTPKQAAVALRPFLDLGFTGFTFNNNIYRTPGEIAVVGELLGLVAG